MPRLIRTLSRPGLFTLKVNEKEVRLSFYRVKGKWRVLFEADEEIVIQGSILDESTLPAADDFDFGNH